MVLLVVLCYAGGLYTVLAMRRTVLVRIPPDRATMYRLGSDGTVYNRFRLQAANRGHQQATLILTIKDLPGARLVSIENALVLNPGQDLQREFEIAVPPSAGVPPGSQSFSFAEQSGCGAGRVRGDLYYAVQQLARLARKPALAGGVI